MKQYPRKLAYKKYHKVNINYLRLIEQKRFFLTDGTYAIQALESGTLSYKQLEACRRTLRRGFGKAVRFWIRPFTYHPVTCKSIGSRMGKGKGSLSHWMAPIRQGQIIFEIVTNSQDLVNLVLTKASSKLPLKVKILKLKF